MEKLETLDVCATDTNICRRIFQACPMEKLETLDAQWSLSTDTNICRRIFQACPMEKLETLDAQWSLWIHGKGQVVPRLLLRLLELSGDGLLWIPAAVAAWFSSRVQSSAELQVFVVNFAIGLLFVDAALVGCLKLLFRRPRPVYNKGMYLVVAMDHWSFPSGHSSRALFIASFFWLHRHLWNVPAWQELLLSLWAACTAASRVLLGRHFVLDVLVGSLLGYLEALLVQRLLVPIGVAEYLGGLTNQSTVTVF